MWYCQLGHSQRFDISLIDVHLVHGQFEHISYVQNISARYPFSLFVSEITFVKLNLLTSSDIMVVIRALLWSMVVIEPKGLHSQILNQMLVQ